jgi:hypothetical protein
VADPEAKHGVGWLSDLPKWRLALALSDLAAAAVLGALGEFDDLGRDAFLNQYGFGKSRGYFVQHDGSYAKFSSFLEGKAHLKLGPRETS